MKQYWLGLIEGNKETVSTNVGNKEINSLEVRRTIFESTDEVEGSIDAEGFENGLDERFSVDN